MRRSSGVIVGRCFFVLVSTIAALGAALPRRADAASKMTYYQVVYADGAVKDLAKPPETNEGIERVVRVTRKSSGQTGYEITATGPDVLTVINPDTILHQEMKWDGEKWAVPKKKRAAEAEPASPLSDLEIRRLKHIVRGLALRVEELAAEVDKADKALSDAAGKPGEAEARAKLAEARRDLEECSRLLAEHEALLELAQNQPVPAARPAPNDPQARAGEAAEEIRKLQGVVAHLRRRLLFFDLAAVETEGRLFEEAGTADAADTRWQLEAINKIRDRLRGQIDAYERKLAKLNDQGEPKGGD